MELLPFKAVYPNLNIAELSDSFSDKVRESYPELKSKNYFHINDKESLIIYEISYDNKKYTGIIGLASFKDYQSGIIKKHEQTLAHKEKEHLKLFNDRNAVVKPILLTYPQNNRLFEQLEKLKIEENKFFECKINHELHQFWQIHSDEIQQEIAEISHLYIADGHHRMSIGNSLYQSTGLPKFEHIPVVLFDFSQLVIKGFHRLVEVNNVTNVLEKLSFYIDYKHISAATATKMKNEFIIYFQKKWYLAKWKQPIIDKYLHNTILLDTEILNDEILKNIFHIHDFKQDQRIQYIEGNVNLDSFVKKVKKDQIFFLLHPLSIEEFRIVSDEDIKMPPKSTWFYPRIRNGLIIYEY